MSIYLHKTNKYSHKRGEWVKRFTYIVLFMVILHSALLIYANSDDGIKLENWYHQAFEYAVNEETLQYFEGIIQLAQIIDQEQTDLSKASNEELGSLSDLISERSIDEVENYQQRYIDIAKQTESELKKQNFAALKEQEKQKLEAELEAEIDDILVDALQ